jgi:aspartokinase
LGRAEERGVIVMKFGGSSVADAERILGVARIVRRHLERRPVVVVSALGGVTDLLDRAFDRARQGDLEGLEPVVAEIVRRHRWALAGCVNDGSRRHRLDLEIDRLFEGLQGRLRSVRILGEGTDRARDAVLAHGEWLAARIVTAALRETELPARRVDPGRLIVTDERFGAAKPRPEAVRTRVASELLPLLEAGEVPVVGGFVGSSEAGETTTLSMVSTLGDRLDGLSCLQDEAEIELSTEHAIACVVGCAVVEEEAVREQVMAELARWKPELVALGALRASVVAVVRRDRLADCVRRLHDRFSEVGGVR